MKLITDDLIRACDDALEDKKDTEELTLDFGYSTSVVVATIAPVIVRKCIRELNAHPDDFIDGHNGKEYFEIVDEILVKVKAALRELIEEKD